jgi:hypothetical protein
MKFSPIALLITLLFSAFFWSCSPKMEIPSYLWIDSVDFRVTDISKYGTASHKITDVWITANGKSLGMYQLPARIPVLESGATRLTVEAGIMLGGVPQKRAKYPFYTLYALTADLKKGEIDTLLPYFTYEENAQIYLKEEFESAGSLFKAYGTSAPLRQTNDPNLLFQHPKEENNYSGLIELPYTHGDTATVYHFEIRTINPIELTIQSAYDCLMELNFCITHNIDIGMITHSADPARHDEQHELAKLTGYANLSDAKAVWKKVYMNLTTEIKDASASQMKNFDIYIKGTISAENKEQARYLFDNIKLIYNK